jgi:glycosyltransferase involved in cell wall biosynthesis
MIKLAIAITTFNRTDILYRGLEEQLKYIPKTDSVKAAIFIVDDGSTDQPDITKIAEMVGDKCELQVHIASENKGIAAAKNKCLEMADDWGADHIFLFDSDTWPRRKGWFIPYVESREPHLMYIFTKFAVEGRNGHNLSDCKEIYRDSEIVAFNHVRGCMLYLDRKVLDVVGGFDVRYGKAMFEHTDYSNRIHNAGLTSFRVMDVPNSQGLIYSMDEFRETQSSISALDRRNGLINNRPLHAQSLTSKEFCRYKEQWSGDRDIVLASYFTSGPDFQRDNRTWSAELEAIEPLKKSVEDREIEFILLHDCFDLPNKVECTMDVYMNRFLRAYEYLRDNEDVRRVFMVDATDVTMLNNPFDQMEIGKIYTGDEPAKLSIRWIRERAQQEPFRTFVMSNLSLQLLNAGIIGGSREDVMMLLHDILTMYSDALMKGNDMVILNFLMRTRYEHKLVHGTGLVNNRFKSFEPTEGGTEWFNHK